MKWIKRIKNYYFRFRRYYRGFGQAGSVHAFEALGFEAHAYINDYVQDGVFA